MRERGYLTCCVALTVFTAACGASTSDKTKVRQDLMALAPGSSTVACLDTKQRFAGHPVVRCIVDAETGVHGMMPRRSCYVWQNARALDVTRRLSHC